MENELTRGKTPLTARNAEALPLTTVAKPISLPHFAEIKLV